jgi:hypothetical protein
MYRQGFLSLVFVSLIGLFVLAAGSVGAYPQYSANKDATYCAACHGDFRASPYISLTEGADWGTDLMSVHATDMLSGDCNTCHSSGSHFPVLTGSSAGGAGLDAISCAGCHGRAEDGTGNGSIGYAAGLRQHHWVANKMVNGISTRVCANCHSDSDPANFDTVSEDILPPYYAANDINHPNIPSDPCNPAADGYPEDYAGSSEGLDNDGNGLYDELDVVACPEPGEWAILLPGAGLLLLIDRRRRYGRAR